MSLNKLSSKTLFINTCAIHLGRNYKKLNAIENCLRKKPKKKRTKKEKEAREPKICSIILLQESNNYLYKPKTI